MGETEIAGFPQKLYKTMQAMARKTATFQRKINGMSVVHGELLKNKIGGSGHKKSDSYIEGNLN